MVLKKTVHGIVCEVCNKRFSGEVPAQQHLQSAAHVRKLQQQDQQTSDPLYCTICRLRCNSPQQLLTHRDSPRHQHMVRQTDIIRQQQALTAAQEAGDSEAEVNGRQVLECYAACERTTHEGQIVNVKDFDAPQNLLNMYGQARSAASAGVVPEGGVMFDGSRGHCFVCNIELTSPQHKVQHVEGKNHKKRVGQGSTTGNTAGIMMCAICEVPLSGHLNVQQHFTSDRHRRRLAEQQQLQCGFSAGGTTQTPPASGSGWSPPYAATSYPGTAFPELSAVPTSSMCESVQSAFEPRRSAPAQDGVPVMTPPPNRASHAGSDSEQLRFEWLAAGYGWCGFCDLRVQSHDEAAEHLKSEEHKRKEEEASRPSCEVCRVKFSGQASAKQHFSSDRHKQQLHAPNIRVSATDTVSQTFRNQSVNLTMTSSQLSHLMSNYNELSETARELVSSPQSVTTSPHTANEQTLQEQQVWRETPLSDDSGCCDIGLNQLNENSSAQFAMTHLNIPPSNYGGDVSTAGDRQPVKEEVPQQPSVPEYVFDGSRGICNVCGVTFTSKPHAEAHLAGAKHQKARQRWQPSQVTSGPAAVTGNVPPPPGLGAGPQPVVESPGQFAAGGQGSVGNKGYRFEGDRGFCFACQIDLTSAAHANQHLTGRKHQTAVERWLQTGEGCMYPLYCDTCHKPFTGQESAAQHFASEKHKKKVQLAAGSLASRKDPETGAVIMVQDGQTWYVCEVCNCPLNTLEQMRIHLRSPRHMKELEKTQKQQHSGLHNVELDDDALCETSGTRAADEGIPERDMTASPGASLDLQHLVIQPSMVTCTPGIFFPPAQKVPDSQAPPLRSGHLQAKPAARAILGCNPDSAPGGASQSMTHSITHSSGSDFYNLPGGGGVVGSQSTGCTSLNLGRGRGILRSLMSNGTSNEARRSASPMFSAQDASDLNLARQVSKSSRGSGRSGMVIRPDGDYEDDQEDDETMEKLVTASSSSYVDRPHDEAGDQPEDDVMSSITTGSQQFSSTVSERERKAASAASTTSNNLSSLLNPDAAGPESVGSLADANQLQPERDVIKGFRYGCQLCQQPMNTKEDYEKHMKGLKHQMKAATVCAPNNSSEPLKKACVVSLEEAYAYVGKSKPRTYQVDLMCSAMAHESTVIYLPTGTGKTLAAMMTLSYMLILNPTRPVLFLVDKVLLVLQQARYIINELGSHEYYRPGLEGDVQRQNKMEKRKLKVAVLCGGLSVRDGTPLWKHDVIVTTAAFCQNLLQVGVLQWANFGLVVFDEAHHCTKNHPYNKLLSEHHLSLDTARRPKVLGLTASPAGRRTKEETLTMLESLLQNLGGATIATVEKKPALEQLEKYSSSAKLVPVCVPMTEAELRFHEELLAYFIRTYLELMRCSNLPQMSDRALQELSASSKPDPEKIKTLAKHLMETPDQLSDMVQLAHAARIKQSSQTCRSSKFAMLQYHVMTVGMALLNSEDGIDFVLDELEREFDPKLNPKFYELCDLGLPCKDIGAFVRSLVDGSRLLMSEESTGAATPSSMSIFQELLCTLADPKYMSWGSDDAMALVLVRERKVAHKVREQLRKTSFVREHNMDVAVVVGHGAGSGEGEGMNLRKQDKVLQGIKSHKYKIVVATSVAEEGVDLPECQLVVCLNPPTTVKAMVQMRGRARKKDSYFVVLCSSQKEKEKLEDLKRQEDNMKWAADHLTHQNTRAAGAGAL
ncbi:hypothetical protein BaRGS_00017301 [Batillaria attramentaria]|uniref:RNA helicase n=1 Tax=Batillaria attramentaria TaxID=370345 RepID=A0ABD0KXH6_9CAEN